MKEKRMIDFDLIKGFDEDTISDEDIEVLEKILEGTEKNEIEFEQLIARMLSGKNITGSELGHISTYLSAFHKRLDESGVDLNIYYNLDNEE